MDRARHPRELIAAVALAVGACGARPPQAPVRAAVAPAVPTEIGRARIVRALAAEGGVVWWSDVDGVYVRAPGAEPRKLADGWTTSIAARGGVAWIANADGVTRVGPDGVPVRIALAPGPGAVAADVEAHVAAGGAGVFAVDRGGARLVELAGDRAVPRADARGTIEALAVGDRWVAWAEWDDAAAAGAVRRLGVGGAPELVARLSAPARGIAIRGDEIMWTGEGAALAAWDGGGSAGGRASSTAGAAAVARTRIAGSGVAIAADRDGVVVHTDAGLVVEHVEHPDGGEAAYVLAQTRPDHDLSPAPIAIDGGVAYVVEARPDGAEAIVAAPRPGHGPRLIALTAGPVQRLVGDEGLGLVATWATGEATSVGRVALAGAPPFGDLASVDAIAAHGGEVWIFDGDAGVMSAHAPSGDWRIAIKPDAAVGAIAVADGATYWIDGAALWRMPSGAAPAVMWRADTVGPIEQPLAGFAVLADGTVVTTGAGFTVGDLVAIGGDGAVRVIAAMGDAPFGAKVVGLGRRVYYVVGGTEVWGVDVDAGVAARPVRVMGPGNAVVDLAAGGGAVYAAVMVDGVAHVVRSSGADAKHTIDLGMAPGFVPGTLVARADGAVWASADAKAILMWPAPAPAR